MAPTLATARNAALRSALRARWPSVPFQVRNGRAGYARVTWSDGPTPADVKAALRAVAGPNARAWGVNVERAVSCELVAVSFVREHATGDRTYYRERDDATGLTFPPGAEPLPPSQSAAWRCCWEELGADDVTATDRVRAQLALAFAGPRTSDGSREARSIARAVALHSDTIADVLK